MDFDLFVPFWFVCFEFCGLLLAYLMVVLLVFGYCTFAHRLGFAFKFGFCFDYFELLWFSVCLLDFVFSGGWLHLLSFPSFVRIL